MYYIIMIYMLILYPVPQFPHFIVPSPFLSSRFFFPHSPFRPKRSNIIFLPATADGTSFIIPNPGCRSFVALPRAINM